MLCESNMSDGIFLLQNVAFEVQTTAAAMNIPNVKHFGGHVSSVSNDVKAIASSLRRP